MLADTGAKDALLASERDDVTQERIPTHLGTSQVIGGRGNVWARRFDIRDTRELGDVGELARARQPGAIRSIPQRSESK